MSNQNYLFASDGQVNDLLDPKNNEADSAPNQFTCKSPVIVKAASNVARIDSKDNQKISNTGNGHARLVKKDVVPAGAAVDKDTNEDLRG